MPLLAWRLAGGRGEPPTLRPGRRLAISPRPAGRRRRAPARSRGAAHAPCGGRGSPRRRRPRRGAPAPPGLSPSSPPSRWPPLAFLSSSLSALGDVAVARAAIAGEGPGRALTDAARSFLARPAAFLVGGPGRVARHRARRRLGAGRARGARNASACAAGRPRSIVFPELALARSSRPCWRPRRRSGASRRWGPSPSASQSRAGNAADELAQRELGDPAAQPVDGERGAEEEAREEQRGEAEQEHRPASPPSGATPRRGRPRASALASSPRKTVSPSDRTLSAIRSIDSERTWTRNLPPSRSARIWESWAGDVLGESLQLEHRLHERARGVARLEPREEHLLGVGEPDLHDVELRVEPADEPLDGHRGLAEERVLAGHLDLVAHRQVEHVGEERGRADLVELQPQVAVEDGGDVVAQRR